MNKESLFPVSALVVGTVLLGCLVGCETEGSGRHRGHRNQASFRGEAVVVYEDDYDYYPGYEIYYSRNRHEYVYRDGGTWVRRPQPAGVSIDILLAAPAVRVDFRDSPEQHHAAVVRSYPKNWKRAERKADERRDKQEEKRDKQDRKEDEKNDRKDDKR